MKCEVCGKEISASQELATALGVIHKGPCPGTEDHHQRYVEQQAQNLYAVWRCANNGCPHTEWIAPVWDELHKDYKKVWYAVTAAALGMHKF